MKMTAHRGLSSLAPENTIAAFELAARYGAKWIELDVQLSQDKVPVVIHDQTVNRCTNGSGMVKEMTIPELKALDAGLWFGETYRDERIPTLVETLRFAQHNHINLNIELKLYEGDDIGLLCQKVKAVIEDVDIDRDQILFSSFSTPALQKMQDIIPTIRRGQLWQEIPDDALSLLSDLDAYSVHCDYRFLNEVTARMIKSNGYQLYCYTPNFPELVTKHWDWGVDMMITDVPQNYIEKS